VVNITSTKRIAIRNQTGASQPSLGLETIPGSGTASVTVLPGQYIVVPVSSTVFAIPDWLAGTPELAAYATGYGQPTSYFADPPVIQIFF
jgi:hypothetical protein